MDQSGITLDAIKVDGVYTVPKRRPILSFKNSAIAAAVLYATVAAVTPGPKAALPDADQGVCDVSAAFKKARIRQFNHSGSGLIAEISSDVSLAGHTGILVDHKDSEQVIGRIDVVGTNCVVTAKASWQDPLSSIWGGTMTYPFSSATFYRHPHMASTPAEKFILEFERSKREQSGNQPKP